MKEPRHDIQDAEDVRHMVDHFYGLVRQDALIGPVFDVEAGVNWSEHLPRMYQFWNTLIFASAQYKGAPFPPHVRLSLSPTHFEHWLSLFRATVDELFEGPVADNTKRRAESIATIFDSKLRQIHGAAYATGTQNLAL